MILGMNHGKTVLAQVLDGLHPESFRRCTQRWPMPRDTPALSAYDQFAAMVFAQLTYRESLRDIEACLASRRRVLYHAGIRGAVKRCNLAYANEHRDWRLFADVAAVLMRQARKLYQDRPAELDLDGDLFALDATVIELSLKLFPWARWQRAQASVKLACTIWRRCAPCFWPAYRRAWRFLFTPAERAMPSSGALFRLANG